MSRYQLSICIATLNRADFIGATLESIISQATDEVEIVVVDGASTDRTPEIVQHHQQQYSHLNYVRLESKGGVDQDFCRAVEVAQGEYCWLFSDDDILKPGAIKAVLDAIKDEHSLILVNADVRTPDLSKVLKASRLSFTNTRVYRPADHEQLFLDTADYLSFIGAVAIRRELWNERDKKSYFGTEFVHIGVIFQKPLPSTTLVIGEPWITIRYGNALWTSRAFQIWMFKWPNIVWSLGYPASAKRKVCRREPWRAIKVLLRYRAKGYYSLRQYKELLELRSQSLWDRLILQLIAWLPGCPMNFLAVLYYRWLRQESEMELFDLRLSPFYCQRYLGLGEHHESGSLQN